MIELRSATEDEMIAAFLRAEITSSRYESLIMQVLRSLSRGRSLIENPDVADATASRMRKMVLGYRGYPADGLFQGFPTDVTWRCVRLELRDFETMRYINDIGTPHRHWDNLTGGTRRVTDGAKSYERNPPVGLAHIAGVLAALRSGHVLQPMIFAEHADGSLILLEGHSRATAYIMNGQTAGQEAFVGSSPSMPSWVFY